MYEVPTHREALHGRWLLVGGSASPASPSELLERSHVFVREVVRQAWNRGFGFVVLASNEPLQEEEPRHPLVFSWTILEEVARLSANDDGCVRVVAITTPKFTGRIPKERSYLLQALVERGVACVETISNDLWVGGRFREMQASYANAMICLGGGKGIADLADKLLTRGMPVLPMDIEIGGISQDGGGAVQLYQEMARQPSHFLRHTGGQISSRLFDLSLRNDSADITRVAAMAVDVISQELRAMDAIASVDILVVTALPVELNAARDAIEIAQDSPQMRTRSGSNIWRRALSSTSSGQDLVVGLCCLGGAGNLGASAVVSELAGTLSPRLVIMVGIAAGIRGKRRLGEVVVNEEIVSYEPSALVQIGDAHTVQARPRTWRTPHAVHQDVVNYLSQKGALGERIKEVLCTRGVTFPKSRGTNDAVCGPTVGFATIGSGEKLFRDSIAWDELRAMHGKIDVAEMEAAGVAQACEQHGVPFLVFRGISDFGDGNKNDRYHWIASVAAAEVAIDFLRYGLALE